MTEYLVTVRSRREPDAPQHLFLLEGDLAAADIERLAAELLHDPVVQEASWCTLDALSDEGAAAGSLQPAAFVEVAYRPGVTDNEAESVRIGAARLGIGGLRTVKTLRRYALARPEDAAGLANDLIQATLSYAPGEGVAVRRSWYAHLLHPPSETAPRIARVPLNDADDEALLRISQQGVLALDLAEMQAVQRYFRREEREPTDGELETIAQTWSEHCSHKTFKGRVRYRTQHVELGMQHEHGQPDPALYPAYHLLQQDAEIDSLIKTFLMAATDRVVRPGPDRAHFTKLHAAFSIPRDSWVLSAFVDNAGIVAFTDEYEVSFKVETHNHPSALEPFGGANTGVGGVVRDVLGVSAQPIANTDVLCFGPLDLPADQLPPGVLHPRRIAAGVVAGVRDYGNKLGIPTVNGAVLYHPGYVANPLVYCGTVGLAPRGRHPRQVHPGDAVVVLGGRTGRDGIHGATFSSIELTHTTAEEVGSAVQIGDPITEKKLIDVILQARDLGLYSAITDCGAGGLSSAVGEMGADCGAAVELAEVPLKYAGLQPWEIWLSEAQERMVLAVPPERLPALLELCASEDVEATVIGRFTDTGRLLVTYRGAMVVDLDMHFLHEGRPQRHLDAVWASGQEQGARRQESADPAPTLGSLAACLLSLLAHPNIASKAPIVRTYDHEVGGRTVAKPLVGARCEGPGDAAVLQPLSTTRRGIAIGCGINPRYGLIDPYWMALACVDEALRNVVAVGGDPAQAAILDNFCWGDPRQPDRMAGLVRAAAGCYDAALAFGTPFISGKDSLNNEYRDAQGVRTPIPPTLLISALAIVPDVTAAVTMDLKEPGSHLYLVGTTRDELGGAHYDQRLTTSDQRDGHATAHGSSLAVGRSSVPHVDLDLAPKLMAAIHTAIKTGLVRACHDLSEGGLGVAAAEMAIAGELGLELDLDRAPRTVDVASDDVLLFSESPTRFLIEVRPADAAAFESALAGLPCARIGTVTAEPQLVVRGLGGAEVLRASVADLKAAWQGTAVV
ncbi:MAG TPA: phosphoribosylformylglycinamidine synthase subunit PurL [Roseiflexaceae bacterium]|nr:phosphoribosylformylglycinamidine synthase subunit PurL [Roseiflexaceae bacterium]